jgi:putative transposase
LALMEMYVEGVSTRKVKDVTEELCGTSFSKSLVSQLAGSLDSELSAWRDRRLEAEAYPYVFVDARYEKVRVDGRVVSQGVLIVSGIRDDGFREVLGVGVADTESEATYHELFRSLKRRGLSGVELVVSDDHEGLKSAIARHFQGASHQRGARSITPGTSSAWWATPGARSSGRTSGRSSPRPTENKPSPSPLRWPTNGARRATRR